MRCEKCEECVYQTYSFLKNYDTMCPFYYDFKECYNKTKGNIKEVVKFDRFLDRDTVSRLSRE